MTLGDNRLDENVVNHYNAENQLVLELEADGNVVQLTDGEGNVTKTYEYDSFGNEVKPEEKDDNPFRYCGEYYDKETGEVYLRARYYQPEKGRFLTRDTYTGEEDEPESLHLYTYCYNNSVLYTDMEGNKPKITVSKPVPTRKPKKVPGPTPKPVPTPRPGPAPTMDPNNPGTKEIFAEQFLKATRWKPLTKIELDRAVENYAHNKKIEKAVLKNQPVKKYITDQSKLSSLRFGFSNMAYAGCELIAVYNAILLANGKKVPLSDIILNCEISGYQVAWGGFGTNPYRIGKLLTECGMKYSVVSNSKKLKMKKKNVYVLSFWNTKNIYDQLHTIAVKVKKRNRVSTYNDPQNDKLKLLSFKGLLKGRPYIIGYKVKGKKK